jgi:hypothetical protein
MKLGWAVLALLFAAPLRAAVELDGSVGVQAIAASELTFSITVGADADELVVCGGNLFGSIFNLTAATYNGDNLVLISSAATGDADSAYLWRLSSPDSGTHDVVLSWDGTGAAVYGFAASFQGVDTGAPVDGSLGGTGTGTSLSKTVTSSADGMAMDCSWVRFDGTPATPGAGQTEITNDDMLPMLSSYKSASGSSTAMTWTLPTSSSWWHAAIAFKAEGGGGGGGDDAPAPAVSPSPWTGDARWYRP